MKFTDWLRDFRRNKKYVGSIPQSSKDAVHTIDRYIDAEEQFWETGVTYTGRLVLRKGLLMADGITIDWEEWQTLHDIEV